MKGLLIVKLFEAKDLVSKDSNGFSDPYFMFTLQNQVAYSSIKWKTLNPVYNGETFNFFINEVPPPPPSSSTNTSSSRPTTRPRSVSSASATTNNNNSNNNNNTNNNNNSKISLSSMLSPTPTSTILEIAAWDKDLVLDDFLGGRKIDLENIRQNEPISMWVKLMGEKSGEVSIQILMISLESPDMGRDLLGFTPVQPPTGADANKSNTQAMGSSSSSKRASLKLSKVMKVYAHDGTALAKKGITFYYKSEMWKKHSGARAKAKGPDQPLYSELIDEVNSTKSLTWQDQIDKDIMRTFVGHPYFQSVHSPGSQSLRQILLAYSVYNPNIGYCQVMNFIGSFLLLLMDEEDAFWSLATVVEDINVDYYSKDMIGLQVDIRVTEHYVQKFFPEAFKHLDAIQANLTILCMQWFLCLFVDIFPTQTTLRLWDIVMCTGRNVLIQVVLQLIKTHHQKILAFKTGGEFYEFCKGWPMSVYDSHVFFKEVFVNFPVLTDIEELRKTYRVEMEELARKRENMKLQRNTKYSTKELDELRSEFLQHSVNNRLSKEKFEEILRAKFGENIPLVNELFEEFDKSRDGFVDFREFSIGLSLLTRGSTEEKLKLCFTLFDKNRDGFIQPEEMTQIMGSQFNLLFSTQKVEDARKFVNFAFTFDKNKDGKLSFEEFKEAILNHPIIVRFFALQDVELSSRV